MVAAVAVLVVREGWQQEEEEAVADEERILPLEARSSPFCLKSDNNNIINNNKNHEIDEQERKRQEERESSQSREDLCFKVQFVPHLKEQLDSSPVGQVGKPETRVFAEGAVLIQELKDGQLHFFVVQEEELQQPL